MSVFYRETLAQVNFKNLDHNLTMIMDLAGKNRFVCPMIKANAYGHGAPQIGKQILKNHQLPLGVVLIEEAVELRTSGIQSEIIVFGGFDLRGAQKIVDAGLTPVVSQLKHLQLLAGVVKDSLDVHVKFNTGMNRLGFDENQVDLVFDFFQKNPKLKMKAILSHLHSAQIVERSQQQAEKLLAMAEHFKKFGIFTHLLNSDAIASLSVAKDRTEKNWLTQHNWGFRPGIMLYGYVTSSINSQLQLKPVMSLKSKVQQIRRVKKGESVSYNATWVAEQDSLVGIVPIGYADGVHRILSNRGHVWVHENESPILGKVCMDFVMIDLTQLEKSEAELADCEVSFFGEVHGADVMAQTAQTISYEILTSVSDRVPRVYE